MFKYVIDIKDYDVVMADEDLNMYAVEEEFAGDKVIVLYSEENLSSILNDKNIEFSEYIIDDDWVNKWKEFLKEGKLTENYFYTFDFNKKNENTIFINPSMAFGTGDHPTTKIAARLLEDVVEEKTVLEVGSGSGILSILASKCKAKKVFACDNDFATFNNLVENCNNNDVKNIIFWCGSIDSLKKDYKVDVVVANIISSILIELISFFEEKAKEYIILSGILKGENEYFKQFIPSNFYIDKELEIDGWWGARLRRCLQ
ncbi:50S ribosomal protein L11 methyltransferase [Deferribacter thermophilus]|uniref:50S ribosomal protein L11 methyltransferase n=1 Tax=Deferribacter thermophilus TaxID=53573 RepID=UPI003C22E02F